GLVDEQQRDRRIRMYFGDRRAHDARGGFHRFLLRGGRDDLFGELGVVVEEIPGHPRFGGSEILVQRFGGIRQQGHGALGRGGEHLVLRRVTAGIGPVLEDQQRGGEGHRHHGQQGEQNRFRGPADLAEQAGDSHGTNSTFDIFNSESSRVTVTL